MSPNSRDESGSSVLYHLHLLQQLTTYTSEHTVTVIKSTADKSLKECQHRLRRHGMSDWPELSHVEKARSTQSSMMWLAMVSSLSIRTPRSLTTAENCTVAFGNVCAMTLQSWYHVPSQMTWGKQQKASLNAHVTATKKVCINAQIAYYKRQECAFNKLQFSKVLNTDNIVQMVQTMFYNLRASNKTH